LRFNYPAEIGFGCSKCGLCCGDTEQKERHVLLLKSDTERIVAKTKRKISTFATETAAKQPYVYEMHKIPQNGKCAFLQQDQCSIYEVRPLICRFYPFELSTDENGVYTFKATEECPSIFRLGKTRVGKKLDTSYFRELLQLAIAELSASSP
jgi:Fe-S-cluster containining protein